MPPFSIQKSHPNTHTHIDEQQMIQGPALLLLRFKKSEKSTKKSEKSKTKTKRELTQPIPQRPRTRMSSRPSTSIPPRFFARLFSLSPNSKRNDTFRAPARHGRTRKRARIDGNRTGEAGRRRRPRRGGRKRRRSRRGACCFRCGCSSRRQQRNGTSHRSRICIHI